MAEKRTIGLKSLKIGAIANDGGMGTVLDTLGVTYEGTAKLTKEEDSMKDFFCEETDDPIEVVSKKGKVTLEWSITDFAPATMAKVLGGTVDSTDVDNPVWKAPDDAPNIEMSIEIITKRNVKIEIPRAKIVASLDLSLGKEDLGTVKIKAVALKPTKAGVPVYQMSTAV